MSTKTKLIEELKTSRADLLALLDEVNDQSEIYPEWQMKEFLAHLSGWDAVVTQTLNALADDQSLERPALGGIDEYNQQVVEQSAELSYNAVLERCHHERMVLVEAVQTLPDDLLALLRV